MRTILIVAALCAACSPPLAPTPLPDPPPAVVEEWTMPPAVIRCVAAPCEPPTLRLHPREAGDEP